jgi:hypothetical protein
MLAQITLCEKAEAALRQMQKIEAIGQLTGGIAHDVNNCKSSSAVWNGWSTAWHSLVTSRKRDTHPIDAASHGADRAAPSTKRLLLLSRRAKA